MSEFDCLRCVRPGGGGGRGGREAGRHAVPESERKRSLSWALGSAEHGAAQEDTWELQGCVSVRLRGRACKQK